MGGKEVGSWVSTDAGDPPALPNPAPILSTRYWARIQAVNYAISRGVSAMSRALQSIADWKASKQQA